MDVEARKVTKRIDTVLCSKDQEALYELLREFTNLPDTLKDVFEYINQRKVDCFWLRDLGVKLETIWVECYLRTFPSEVPAIYEYHYFSQFTKGQDQYEKYGVVDMTLGMNFSNIKGFAPRGSSRESSRWGVREFFLKERGSVRDQLYPSLARSGSVLNPNDSEWKEWRMFHLKMRQITFHFLCWLCEKVPEEEKQLLIQYGISLMSGKWAQSLKKSEFFLPFPTFVSKEEAQAKLEEIITKIDSGSNDRDLFVLTYNQAEMRDWMSDGSLRMSHLFRDRCISSY